MDDLLQEMIDPTPEPGDRPRRRRLVATIAIVGLAVIGVTSLTTGALFTDREQTDDGFTTGTVDLTVGQLAFTTTADNLVPGDTTYSAIEVRNTGSLSLRYSVEYTATNAPAGAHIDDGVELPADGVATQDDAGSGTQVGGNLTDVLRLSVYQVANQGACAAPTAGDRIFPAQAASAVPHLVANAATPLIGNAATGQNPTTGDLSADRTLGSAGSEWLCFVTTMDTEAGNAYQDGSAHLTLDFYAEQTDHN